jgi:DNA-binding transcriptional ArsR family regulator
MSPLPKDDAVWRALAHPTRRRILDELRRGPQTTGALTSALGGNRHQILQHLGVLRAADLVLTEARGRTRMNHLNAVPIRLIYERWVSKYEDSWTAALVGLRDVVERHHDERRNIG